MIKILFKISVILCLFVSSVYAEIINEVEIKNNNRISKQTIITYGNVELNKDYNLNEINQILKNLYETNFFESLKIKKPVMPALQFTGFILFVFRPSLGRWFLLATAGQFFWQPYVVVRRRTTS